jgi:hypothetical protein
MVETLDPESNRTFRRNGGEIGMKKLMLLGLIAGAAAVAAQWPEIQRYMKIRAM